MLFCKAHVSLKCSSKSECSILIHCLNLTKSDEALKQFYKAMDVFTNATFCHVMDQNKKTNYLKCNLLATKSPNITSQTHTV